MKTDAEYCLDCQEPHTKMTKAILHKFVYPRTIKALSHGDGNGFSKGSIYTFNFTHETMLAGCYEGNNNNGHNRFVTYCMIKNQEKSPHGNGYFSLVDEVAA